MKKMKLYIISGLFLLCHLNSSAQQLIGTGGEAFSEGNINLSWSIGEPITRTLLNNNVALTQGYQQAWERYQVYGQLSYANNFATPLSGVLVEMHKLGAASGPSNRTNDQGVFYLYNADPASYAFSGSSTLPVGSVNATDALLVMRHFVQYVQLDKIHRAASDVNADGAINATDALNICRYFVDSIQHFSAGDWIIGNDTIILGSGTQRKDIEAICYGDANGSYIPGEPVKKSIWLKQEGEIHPDAEKEFLIPVNVSQSCKLGAISLAITETMEALEFLGVEMKDANGHLSYSTKVNQLRIAWFSPKAISLNKNEALLQIRVRVKDISKYIDAGIQLQLEVESEVADESASPYTNLALWIPELKLELTPEVFSIAEVYPIPASDQIHLRLGIPYDSEIRMGLYDIRGALIGIESEEHLMTGVHNLQIDVSHLPTGMYFIEALLSNAILNDRIVRKFVVLRNR